VKLRGLVSEHLKIDVAEATRLGGGASVIANSEGWIYFPTFTRGILGTAVIWATANDCSGINLIVDEGAGELAHAASAFAAPVPTVWQAIGRTITAATPEVPIVAAAPSCAEFTAVLAAAGLDVVADHGVWLGEINGLEVARVGERGGECSIDIGVGAYDQFASAALNVDRDIAASLATVVSMVRPHRIAGADPHAIGRLVRSRWLRSQIVRNPELIRLDMANPIPLLRPRPGLNESQPAAALGQRGDTVVLVACTVGLDLGIVETAAGLAALHQPDELIVVVPPRDLYPRIIDSVALLALPSSVVAIDGEWST
jgi:hypothetical protein